MNSFGRKRHKKIRKQVIARDGPICLYCGKTLAPKEITLDHIVPDSHDGAFNIANLTVACQPCNVKRGNKTFFKYIKKFNFSKAKLKKYQRLYHHNIRISVLNIATQHFLINDFEIPQEVIQKSCHYLNVGAIQYDDLMNKLSLAISFQEYQKKKEIITIFDQLIKSIEDQSAKEK